MLIDEAGCPDGYRRYVYRVKVELPFKKQFRQEPVPGLLETEDCKDRLGRALGARVELKERRLIIHFSSKDEGRSICNRILSALRE